VFHYYCGLDLAQSQDFTALAIIEEPLWLGSETDWSYFNVYWPERVEGIGGWVSPSELGPRYAHNALWVNYNYGRPAHPPLYLRHLERFELGTKYTEIVARVRRILLRDPIRRRLVRTRLLVDKTGVGAAVVDSFKQAGVNPISITIHGGSAVTWDEDFTEARVPKRDLVAAVQTLLQNERLKVAESLELAPTLKKELLNFRVKIRPETAHDSYEHWREGDHDDLVLATALACWYREYKNAAVEQRNARQGGFRDVTSPGDLAGFSEYAR
jgi:hypothetical protein